MIKCFRFVDASVLVNEHGLRSVNCKPAIGSLRYGKTVWQNCCKMSCQAMLLVNITHVQTRLATNRVVAGSQKFLQKVENSFTFCKKSLHVARFTGPRQTCFAASDVNPVHGSRHVLDVLGGKTRNIAFKTFYSNAADQSCTILLPFYRSFKQRRF